MKRSNENGAKKIYESPSVTKDLSEIRNAMSWVKTFQIAILNYKTQTRHPLLALYQKPFIV